MDISRRWFVGCAASLAAGSSRSVWAEELIPNESSSNGAAVKSKGLNRVEPGESASIRILFNENPLGPPESARNAVVESAALGNFYPFQIAQALIRKLHLKLGLSELPPDEGGLSLRDPAITGDHQIVLGGGSSELLLAAALGYTTTGGNVVEPAPSYEAVGAAAARRPGPAVQRRQIPLRDDGRLDVDGLLGACDAETRILVVTNPNNPTGGALAKDAMRRLVHEAPSHVLVFIDEAYIDFLPDAADRSMILEALQRDNVLVTRTFSKLFGMAGLRVGYAFGHKTIFDRMRPFHVGGLSLNATGLAAAIAALDDDEFQERSRTMAAESRAAITSELRRLGFYVSDSDAACVWVDWGRPMTPLVRALAGRNILLCDGMRWNAPNAARISVATESQTARLLTEINDLIGSV